MFVIILITRAISFAKGQGPDIRQSSKLLDRVKSIIPKRKEQTREVEREIKDDKKEQKTIKKGTVKLTDREIGNLKDTRIQIFIGRTYGHILVPVVLNSRSDPNLSVQGRFGIQVSSSVGEVSIERS
jgi:hypothetical protein